MTSFDTTANNQDGCDDEDMFRTDDWVVASGKMMKCGAIEKRG